MHVRILSTQGLIYLVSVPWYTNHHREILLMLDTGQVMLDPFSSLGKL